MRIAIIGATGMLGHHSTAAAVEAGHEVVVTYRNPRALERLGGLKVEGRPADLDDPGSLERALRGVDAVINCAGYYPTLPRPWRDEVATATGQMENFYAACAGLPLKSIVYVGGSIALPRHPDGLQGDESLRYPGEPADTNPYVQVKWALDALAQAKAASGLPVSIGIPTMTLGEHDYGPSTGQLIVGIANRTLPGYVKGKRNVIYAGDAGRGLVKVAESGKPGERYLLAGRNLSMDDLVEKIARIAGAPVPRPIPLAAARTVSAVQTARYRWLKGPPPSVTATAIAVMSAGQFLTGAKAERELGFRAGVSIDDAVSKALAWFRQVGYAR